MKLDDLKKARPDFFESTDDYIKEMADSKNNFSYWFPKIENCGIKVPRTHIFQIPVEFTKAIHEDRFGSENWEDKVYEWVKNDIMPNIKDLGYFVFLKNGTFSNKFQGWTCRCMNNVFAITHNFGFICYASACLGAGGNTEFIIREQIPMDRFKPTIYEGLPLTNEFRVFYDFDNRRVLSVVNYWDYDYCYKHIYNEGDKIIFNATRNALHTFYKAHRQEIAEIVSNHMGSVNLNGVWSVDLLWDSCEYWLIDMALGNNSAYYKG